MRRRYEELDTLRGIAIIGVLLIHISAGYIGDQDAFALFINQTSRFAVPAFVFLSGIGLTLGKKINEGYFVFLWRQLSKVILLFFIWNLVYYFTDNETYSLLDFSVGFLTGTNYYHLYYVPVIIFFYLIYPTLIKISKGFYGLLFILCLTILSQLADLITGVTVFNLPLNIFNWIFYFVFGLWLADGFDIKLVKIKKQKFTLITLLIISSIGVFLEPYLLSGVADMSLLTTSMRPSIMVYSVIFILTILSFDWDNSWIKERLFKLSAMSYGIYLSHVFVLELFDAFYTESNFTLQSVVYIPVSLIIVVIISLVISLGLGVILKPLEDHLKGLF